MTTTAIVVAHSVCDPSPPIITLQLRYPKFIHSEFMTHRVFSRNASSSRAIPVERLIKDVVEDPVYPSYWGKNQPGMQAHSEHNEPVIMMAPDEIDDWDITDIDCNLRRCHLTREEAWDEARQRAVTAARAFARAGYHKQIVNRLLEPFCHINVVVTSTEWDNFFELRCHPDAQPEMRALAEAMRDAISQSEPRLITKGRWHLPYVDPDMDIPQAFQVRASVARCARVSYLTQEGKSPSIDEDLRLYDRLMRERPLHASPAEHQATPDTISHLHGNLRGWIQYRKLIEAQTSPDEAGI